MLKNNNNKKEYSMTYKIMLVDDHPLFRMGLKLLLEKEEDLSIISENSNPKEAWQIFRKQEAEPDLIICDLSFQEDSGLSLVKKVRDSGSPCPILILSMHDESFWAERVLQEGVNGYVMKDHHISTVIEATRAILNGEIFLTKSIQQKLLRQMASKSSEQSALQKLSVREDEIFQCMAQEMSTPEIAKYLYISIKTVQTHQANIKKKLKITSLSDLRNLASKYSNPKHK